MRSPSPRFVWTLFAFFVVVMVLAQIMSVQLGFGFNLFIAGIIVFPAVGAVVTARQPDNRIGWILLAVGVEETFANLTGMYAAYGLENPGTLPRPDVALAVNETLWVPM